MTSDLDWAELEGELRARLPSDISRVLVGREDDENGIRHVFFFPKRLLTQDEVVAVCREMAPIIRARIPNKPDRWTAAIGVQRISGEAMGVCYLGWENQPDKWKFFGQQTDHADWVALYQRLKAVLSGHGVEKLEGEPGDFFLDDEDDGLTRLRLAIHRIEFLTPQLVNEIQTLLTERYAEWAVIVRLFLPSSERIPHDGILIRANEIVEHWDWAGLKKRLGERLKL